MKPIIEINNVSKKFRINENQQSYVSLRDSLTNVFKKGLSNKKEDFWALKEVSFNLMPGDTMGIIGKNGAGKSTLLKVLSRITPPTSGSIKVRGRIASLLEVGTGFHPELSGRENVFLNGSILGMKRAEIKHKFDEIVEFSGVSKFIDTPLKHYSSGMQLRLAFAVAAFLENEILIIDEVLAVGDAEFQKKCMGKMQDVSKSGRTIVFVSHNMLALQSLCKTSAFLEKGKLISVGNTNDIIHKYLQTGKNNTVQLSDIKDRQGSQDIKLTKWYLKDSSNQIIESPVINQPFSLNFEYITANGKTSSLKNVHVSVALKGLFEEPICIFNSSVKNEDFLSIPERGVFSCDINGLPIYPGSYTLTVYCKANDTTADWIQNAGELEVTESNIYGTGKLPLKDYGTLLPEYTWKLKDL